MGPDFGSGRHHLGKEAHCFKKKFLKSTFLLCLLACLFASWVEVRAELVNGSPSLDSFPLSTQQGPSPGNIIFIPALSSYLPFPSLYPNSRSKISEMERSVAGQLHISSRPEIQKYIRHFQKQEQKTFKNALQHSHPYLPIMSEILKHYGLPQELVYIVLVESRFKNKTMSEKGAAGYWQLMPSTARSLGLRVDRWVDERMDLIKSTDAAARYLVSLYDRFHSWPLTLAAYNGGETALTQAITKHKTKNFWKLSKNDALPKEVREYVPKVFAAILMTRDLEAYGFKRPRYLSVYAFDSVRVWNPLDLELIAGWIDSSVNHLRELNPSLRQDRLPPSKESFILHLPIWGKDKFNAAYQNYLVKLGGKAAVGSRKTYKMTERTNR